MSEWFEQEMYKINPASRDVQKMSLQEDLQYYQSLISMHSSFSAMAEAYRKIKEIKKELRRIK